MNARFRIVARRTAWVLLVLTLLGIIAWTTFNIVGASRYEAALRSLEEDGYATSLAALAPPSLPTGDNAAPFFSAAFALHVKPPAEADHEIDFTPDPPGKIAGMPPEHRATLKAWLESNQEAFDMVSRGRKRSRCRYNREFSLGFSMLLPEISEILSLARALESRAFVQSLDGNAAGAQESVLSILALGESLRDEPVLVEQLVRFLTLRLAMAAIDACVTATTPEEELRRWSALLPDEGVLDGALDRAFRGEMGMMMDTIAGPQGDFWNLMMGKQSMIPLWIGRPLVRSDAARYLAVMRQSAEACRKPYLAARPDLERIEGLYARSVAWTRPVCGALLPAMVRSLETVTAAQAHVAVIRAGLAAEAERRKTGKYPGQMEIRDPFSGKPLLYRREAGQILSDVPAAKSDRIEWVLRAAGK